MKRFFYYFVPICFLLACRPTHEVPRDLIRIQMGADPPTLNLITSTDAYAAMIDNYIFDSLIERDYDTLEFKPKLATHWTISPDKKTYTFYLRKDVTWHDGHPFTADDVVYSYHVIKNPNTNAPHLKVYYQSMDSVTKIDDYTVQFHYNEIYFLGLSICGTMPVVPKHLVEKYQDFEAGDFSRHPIGTGPYKFESWQTNSKILLTRNEDYWGEKPEIRTIEFKIISDASIAFQILKKGDLDYSGLTSIQWARQTQSKKFDQMFYKLAYADPGYTYIAWNNGNAIFQDPRVRRAMTHLVDRKKIVDKIYFGLGKIIVGCFFPSSKQYNTTIQPLEFDPGKARQILKEAGWTDTDGDGVLDKDGKVFEFNFLYPASAKVHERIATILKEDLSKIGIVMHITRLEWAAFLDRITRRDFDATSLGWTAPFESDPYQVWDISQAEVKGSSNFISYKNVEASALLSQARIEFDEEKRNALYWKFQEIVNEDQPYTFMFNTPALVVVSKRFSNVKIHKAGLNLLEWKISK